MQKILVVSDAMRLPFVTAVRFGLPEGVRPLDYSNEGRRYCALSAVAGRPLTRAEVRNYLRSSVRDDSGAMRGDLHFLKRKDMVREDRGVFSATDAGCSYLAAHKQEYYAAQEPAQGILDELKGHTVRSFLSI